MAKNVTSVAVEFGVELDKFKRQLEQAGDLSTQAQREAVKMWIKEEKKRTKEAENAAKQRERAEKRAAAEAEKAQKQVEEATKKAKAETQALISKIPGIGPLADAYSEVKEKGAMAAISTNALTVGLGAAAVAVAAVVGAVGVAVGKFAELRAENEETRRTIAGLNQTTGLTSKTLGALQLAGGPEFLQRFGDAAGEFQKRLSDAGRGTGELLPYLKSLGVEIRDQNGDLRDTDSVLRDYVDALQEAGPSADSSAAATGAFGAAGRELMAVLGDTDLETYAKLADTFGADVGPAAMDATREWGVQNQALKESLRGAVDRTSSMILSGLDLSEVLYGISSAVLWLDAQIQAFGTGTSPIDYVRTALGEMALPMGVLLDKSPLLKMAIMQLGFGTLDVADAQDKLSKSEKNLSNARVNAAVRYGKSIAALDTRLKTLRDAAKETQSQMSGMFDDPEGPKGKNAKDRANRRREEAERELDETLERMLREQKHENKIAEEQERERERELNADLDRMLRRQRFENRMADERKRREEQERRERELAAEQELREREKLMNDIFTAASTFSQTTGDLITNIGEHVKQQHGEDSVAYKNTMRDLFAAQKAAAISEIVIAGAVAIANAYKLNPVFGAVMTPIIAANSAVQIATVASEQPSFHTGGMIPSRTAAPDEVGITALSGEGVVSRRGMAALDAINRGDMMGGGSQVVVYGARVFDAVQGDLIQTPTSSISRAIRAKTRRRVGHRS